VRVNRFLRHNSENPFNGANPQFTVISHRPQRLSCLRYSPS
jgi:hypothetical protein